LDFNSKEKNKHRYLEFWNGEFSKNNRTRNQGEIIQLDRYTILIVYYKNNKVSNRE
jgi:alanyl-tRNA synthetase